jgi:hypothetical protein
MPWSSSASSIDPNAAFLPGWLPEDAISLAAATSFSCDVESAVLTAVGAASSPQADRSLNVHHGDDRLDRPESSVDATLSRPETAGHGKTGAQPCPSR